ncbi:ankyrin repeat [Fusarium sp. NRRL 52700]|nr:ankyrin repeat [Fusarium sp. NRRL 52700]
MRLSRLFSKQGNGNSQVTEATSNGTKVPNDPAPVDLKEKQPRSQQSASQTNTANIGRSETASTSDEDQSPCGIREVVPQSNENPNCVDIVAIHGLNGHRDKTWIDKATRLNWLEDKECLQKDFPAARILTFGYNSRTYFSRSISDVRDFSSELLAALKAWRRSAAEQSRPLVFICHSLGGLVFKQAVIHAHEQNHHYSSILDNIHGVVFFATPHRGSDLAFWDDIGTTLVPQVEDPVPGTCKWVLSHEKWLQWDSLPTPALLWITADAGCGKSVLAKFLAEHLRSKRDLYPQRHIFHFFFKEGLENQDNASKAVSALLHQLCCSQRHVVEHVVEKYTSTSARLFNQFTFLSATLMTILKDPRTRDIVWILDGLDECDRQSLEQLIKVVAAYFDSQSTTEGSRSSACCFKMVILSRPHNLIQQKLHLRRKEDHLDTQQHYRTAGEPHNKMRLIAEEETAAIAKDTTLFVRSKIIELRENSDLFPEVLQRLEERLINGADFTFLWISLVIKLVEDTEVDGISMAQLESILNTTSLDDVYERFLSGRPLPLKARKALMLVLAAVRPLTLKELCAAIEIRQDHFPQTSDDAQARETLNKYKLDESSLGKRVKPGESSISKGSGARGLGSHPRDKKIESHHTTKGRNTKLDKSDIPMAGSHNSAKISSLSALKEVLRKPFSNHLRQICGHFLRIRGREVFLVHQTAREFLLGRYNTAIPEIPLLETGGYRASFRDSMARTSVNTSGDMQVSIGNLSRQGWRHSIRLADANRYLLQICADYIELFAFERIGGKTRWANKDAIAYLKECRDDPPRAFFKYAAFNWIHHYRPIRQSFDFSYDYLLKPSEQHFKVWIIVHRSWMPEEERHQLEAGGIPIHNGVEQLRESGTKVRVKWSKDSMHERALNKADKRAADLEGVLEHFHLNPEAETETYRSQYLDGDQYWKRDEDHQLKSIDADDGDRRGGDEDDTLEDVNTAGLENWKIPDRVQFFWRQNRREVLETLEEVSNPFSPTGGNPTSYFTTGPSVFGKTV